MGNRSRRVIISAFAIVMAFSHTVVSFAQFGGIVFDPNNYRQNLLTAIRSYSQVVQQANQLRNEAQMLINQAKHLSKLDVNTAADLNRILGEIAYLNAQADNVAYEVGRTKLLVKEHYPDSYEGLSDDEFTVRAEEQWQMSRRAHNDAMIMQSKMVESLTEDRAIFNQLMFASHNSVGELQAVQSTNQLLGLLVKQSMQAQQMQITQGRAESIELARRLAVEKESKILRERFVGSASAYGGGGQ